MPNKSHAQRLLDSLPAADRERLLRWANEYGYKIDDPEWLSIALVETTSAKVDDVVNYLKVCSDDFEKAAKNMTAQMREEKQSLIEQYQTLEKAFEKTAAGLAYRQENIMLQKFDAIVSHQMKEATAKYLSKFVQESIEEASNVFGQKSGKIWNAIWMSALATSGFWLVAIYYILKTRG